MYLSPFHRKNSNECSTRKSKRKFAGALQAGYTLKYAYNPQNSQQLTEVADTSYRTTGTIVETPGRENPINTRRLLWDEENRLLGVSDNGKTRYDSLDVPYKGTENTATDFWTYLTAPDEKLDQFFYHPDHLGSSSIITNITKQIVQHLEYVPFGEVFVDERITSNHPYDSPYKFNAKELDEETGLYYYGARYLDPRLSLWLSVDPLAEKYPNVGSYVYCVNNPIKFVDPDGRKLEFAPGVSKEFKQQFTATVKFMNEKGTSGLLAKLQASPNKIVLSETSGFVNTFSANKKGEMVIEWNPNLAKITNEGVSLSPATLLNHEADHANQYDSNNKQFSVDTDPKTGADTHFGNKEEKRVIEGVEQRTAIKHGEINKGEWTRKDHGM